MRFKSWISAAPRVCSSGALRAPTDPFPLGVTPEIPQPPRYLRASVSPREILFGRPCARCRLFYPIVSIDYFVKRTINSGIFAAVPEKNPNVNSLILLDNPDSGATFEFPAVFCPSYRCCYAAGAFR
jgi:hypothetical protein